MLEVRIDEVNGNAKVVNERGDLVVQFAPYSGSFVSGQVDEARGVVIMRYEHGVGLHELNSGIFKGWN